MKLTKILAAAAVVAIGATAQAGERASDTYCVITLPVVAGYNFYGVAVNPAANAKYADVLGVSETTSFISTSTGENNSISGAAAASQGTALWYYRAPVDGAAVGGAAVGAIYQFGIDSEAEATYTVPAGATAPVVFKKPLTLAAFTTVLSENSNKVYSTTKSNIVSVWDAASQKYVKYYYKTGTGWRIYGSNATVNPAEVQIPVGSAVFIHPSTNFGQTNVSFTF